MRCSTRSVILMPSTRLALVCISGAVRTCCIERARLNGRLLLGSPSFGLVLFH